MMEMKKKKKNSGLGYCILGVAGKLLEALKKKNSYVCKAELEWLLPISSTGARSNFEVVTGRQQVRRAEAAARAAAHTTAPVRAHDLGNACATWARQGEVKTSFWRRDLDWRSWCHDIPFGVATWLRLGLKGPGS